MYTRQKLQYDFSLFKALCRDHFDEYVHTTTQPEHGWAMDLAHDENFIAQQVECEIHTLTTDKADEEKSIGIVQVAVFNEFCKCYHMSGYKYLCSIHSKV